MPDRERGRNKRPQSKSEMKIKEFIDGQRTELEDKRPTSGTPSAALCAAMKQHKAAPRAQTSLLPQLPPLVANSLTLTFIPQQRRKNKTIIKSTTRKVRMSHSLTSPRAQPHQSELQV